MALVIDNLKLLYFSEVLNDTEDPQENSEYDDEGKCSITMNIRIYMSISDIKIYSSICITEEDDDEKTSAVVESDFDFQDFVLRYVINVNVKCI